MPDHLQKLLQSQFGRDQWVWASVQSELIGAEESGSQAKAIKQIVVETLSDDEALFVFAIRRGRIQQQLCGRSSS